MSQSPGRGSLGWPVLIDNGVLPINVRHGFFQFLIHSHFKMSLQKPQALGHSMLDHFLLDGDYKNFNHG